MRTILEFIWYLGSAGKGWLVPILLGLAMVAGLMAVGQNAVLAPFVYTVF